MEGKKVLAAAGLIIVIVAAIVFAVKMNSGGTGKIPEAILKKPVTMVDVKTIKTVETTNGKLIGSQPDPQTGYYTIDGQTLANPMTCDSCKKIIPVPPMAVAAPPSAGAVPDPKAAEAEMKKIEEVRSKYICPLCGKKAMPSPGGPG